MSLLKLLNTLSVKSYSYQTDVRKAYIYVPQEYDSYLTRKLIGELTKDGNKQRAAKFAVEIVRDCLSSLNISSVAELEDKLEAQIMLNYEFKPYRLGAYTYKIPSTISSDKARRQSYKRCFKLALKRKGRGAKGKTVCQKVVKEITDIVGSNTGATIQRLNELKKLAAANRAYQYLLQKKR